MSSKVWQHLQHLILSYKEPIDSYRLVVCNETFIWSDLFADIKNNVNRHVRINSKRSSWSYSFQSPYIGFPQPLCHTFPPPLSWLPTTISLDSLKLIANSIRDLWPWDFTSHRSIVLSIDPYPIKSHAASFHPPFLAPPHLHKPAISLISTVDRELWKGARSSVC